MHYRLFIKLAWRNLWRNYRRTLIMLAAIIVGVWAMIFMTALMRGMVDNAVQNGLQAFVGHMQIHHRDYLQDPAINNAMRPPSAQLKQALRQAEAWTQRVRVPAMLSSARANRGVTLMGIEPENEARVSFLADNIVEGRYLEGPEDQGIIIGRALAEKLETDLGKRIVVMSQDPQNNVVDRGARIVGIYQADLSATEEGFAFMSIHSAQKFLGLDNAIHEIEIMGRHYRELDSLYTSIAGAVEPPNELLTWQKIQPFLSSMLQVMDSFTLIWMVVVFIALSFGLINTLVMAVFERTREFGLMLALGMKPPSILLQVLLEALFLLVLGLCCGTLLALLSIQPLESGFDVSAFAEGMEMFGVSAVLYPVLTLQDIVMANVIVIVLGLLASLLPALRASHLKPIESLNVT